MLYVVVSLFDATKPSYYIIMIIAEQLKWYEQVHLDSPFSGGLDVFMAHWSNELYADMFMGKILIRFFFVAFFLLIPDF